MASQNQEFSIYFHGSLLRSQDKATIHTLARIAHYFRFHYRCRVRVWNPNRESFKPWDPQVIQAIPYPQIPAVEKIDGAGPRVILASSEEEKSVSRWLEEFSDAAVFTLERNPPNLGEFLQHLEGALQPVIEPFRISLAPGQRFYDIYLEKGSWEEVFLPRVDALPLDDPGFRKFGPFPALRELEYAWSLGQLDRRPGMRTLDIGSYKTWVPRYLAESGLDVVSIDIDPEAIEFQKKQAAQSAKPFAILHADSTKIPLPDGTVDQILAISTVEHFDGSGDSVAMREYFRLLRPGGLVILTVPYDHYWCHLDTGLRPGGGLQRYYSMDAAISRLVLPPMFEIVAIEFIGGKMLEIGKFIPDYRNPTNAHLLCLCLRKPTNAG